MTLQHNWSRPVTDLRCQMAELYATEKTARSNTAKRVAKIFIRRKAASGRVSSQSPNEPERLTDLRSSLHISYVDLYSAILKATAKLVCALDDSRWEKKVLRRVGMALGWSEWESIFANLNNLEEEIEKDENSILNFGQLGPAPTPPIIPSHPKNVTATAQTVRRGRNALHTAAVSNDLPTVVDLLSSGRFDINARTKNQWTALSLAAEKGFLEVAQVLLCAPGVDINARNGRGDTAIHVAAINNRRPEDRRVPVISLLASHGAQVDARNTSKRTAFLDAAKHGALKVLQVLRQNGADINQVTGVNGWSALHEAQGGAHFEVVKWLLRQGIDTKIKAKGGNNRGLTAAEVARKRKRDEIARLIEASESTANR